MAEFLTNLSLLSNVLIFSLCALGVWMSGARLTYLADSLADRLNLAKSLVGLLFLSLATSLPEVATTLVAAARQHPDLVLSNLFGGIALQTAILATADLWARGAITNYPRKANHALEATLLVSILAISLTFLLLEDPVSFGSVGLGSISVAVSYGAAVWLLRHYDGESDWVPVDLPDVLHEEDVIRLAPASEASTGFMLFMSGLACFAILVLGLLLVSSAQVIAEKSGLGTGFIGVTLLAGATSLPELTTSITAVRMGAYTMAISNIFGSNLIMLVLVFPADLLYVSGPIMRGVGSTASLAICFGIIVTSIYLVGLIVRRKARVGKMGVDSVLVLAVFAISLVVYYLAK